MSRGVWVLRDGELIERHLAPPLHPKFATSAYVIGDCMDRTLNPADGRYYESKSAYYKGVRAAGCEIVGNETQKEAPRAQMSDPIDDIKAAIEQVESRAPRAKRKGRNKRGI